MKSHPRKIITFCALLLLFGSLFRWQRQETISDDFDFDYGHAWIAPEPAAEIHLILTGIENPADTKATAWVYHRSGKLENTSQFINYDAQQGVQSDAAGEIVLYFLGGGSYEVPMNADGDIGELAKLSVQIELPGYQQAVVNLTDLVYDRGSIVREVEIEHAGEMITMNVLEVRVEMEKQ